MDTVTFLDARKLQVREGHPGLISRVLLYNIGYVHVGAPTELYDFEGMVTAADANGRACPYCGGWTQSRGRKHTPAHPQDIVILQCVQCKRFCKSRHL